MAQDVFGSGGRFRAQQAPGMDITIPAAKVRRIRKRLGLSIGDKRELCLGHTQDLVIPVRNKGDKIFIPLDEVSGPRRGAILASDSLLRTMAAMSERLAAIGEAVLLLEA